VTAFLLGAAGFLAAAFLLSLAAIWLRKPADAARIADLEAAPLTAAEVLARWGL
jgi:hypothetical protein